MQPQMDTIPDLAIESVSDDGKVVMRFPSGRTMQFEISIEMVPYYRRLAESTEATSY